MKLVSISAFSPPSEARAWLSAPHPSLPLLASASSDRTVRIYSLQSFHLHSNLEGGHKRSVRSLAWKPNLRPGTLSLVTGSFDATAGVWRRNEEAARTESQPNNMEIDVLGNNVDDEEEEAHDWEFSLVLEGHDSEIKSVAFSPSGQYLATCSRDKSVWIWEEIGAEGEDEWETVAVLQEHEGDVKYVSWCPDDGHGEVLASASYDDTVRLWREDGEGEWGCVAVLNGHDGTVWAMDWEGPNIPIRSRSDKTSKDIDEADDATQMVAEAPLRLMTCSADATIRVWRKVSPTAPQSSYSSNGIPSTMRPAPSGETWVCEATLPKVHDRPIYSVSWSKKSGRVVSTGSDSLVVIYEERPKVANGPIGDTPATEIEAQTVEAEPATDWHVLTTLSLSHGPYEINHAIWCPRFDGGRKGEEEMVVTTGDDGVVRAWSVEE